MEILGIDVGGSGTKGAIIDTEKGEMVTDRLRIPTPDGFKPKEVVATIHQIVDHFDYRGPLGVGFPAVVMKGRVITPPTAHAYPCWERYPLALSLSELTGCPTTVLNDADAAGMAEMRFGAGRDVPGTVMIFTLGTGIGGSIFINGRLVPNFEPGRLYLRKKKKTAERWTSNEVRKKKDMSWKKWGKRLNKYFNHIELIFWPDLIIISGGVSKKHKKYFDRIKLRQTEFVPAAFRNEAGIVGAAMTAWEAANETAQSKKVLFAVKPPTQAAQDALDEEE